MAAQISDPYAAAVPIENRGELLGRTRAGRWRKRTLLVPFGARPRGRT